MDVVFLGQRQAENYRSWIRQNSECTEFWRIQLRTLNVLSRFTVSL